MKLQIRELISLSLIAALTLAAKELFSFLPNIEPVTMLFICTTLVYGAKAFYPCYIYIFLEGLLYGFGLWFLSYLYVWAVLILIVLLLKNVNSSWVVWTLIGAVYGLLFGPLCALETLVVGGWRMAFSFWISGIPYDIIHCIGNAVVCGLLLRPLTMVLQRLALPKSTGVQS